MKKIWEVFPRLTKRIWRDHAEAGMLGGHHDPDHAIRVGQMAAEISEWEGTAILAGAAGLCHNADRILAHTLGVGDDKVPEGKIRALVEDELCSEGNAFSDFQKFAIADAVVRHTGKNDLGDFHVLVALMDADRLVNSEPDFVIRSGQHYNDLPPIDPVHFWSDPSASYRDPKSVLRDIMEVLPWLTPGTDFYVRLPKSREIAARRLKFFEDFGAELIRCREETGFCPYPPELRKLREKFMSQV